MCYVIIVQRFIDSIKSFFFVLSVKFRLKWVIFLPRHRLTWHESTSNWIRSTFVSTRIRMWTQRSCCVYKLNVFLSKKRLQYHTNEFKLLKVFLFICVTNFFLANYSWIRDTKKNQFNIRFPSHFDLIQEMRKFTYNVLLMWKKNWIGCPKSRRK